MLYFILQSKDKKQIQLYSYNEWLNVSKDLMSYLISFEAQDLDTANKIYEAYKLTPDLFYKNHEELILEIQKLREINSTAT